MRRGNVEEIPYEARLSNCTAGDYGKADSRLTLRALRIGQETMLNRARANLHRALTPPMINYHF
jgi:hypothetical protein